MVLLEQHTANNSPSLNFTASITAAYDEYLIEFLALKGAIAAWLDVQLSTDGGTTWDASSSYYGTLSGATQLGTAGGLQATTPYSVAYNQQPQFTLATGVDNWVSGCGASGFIRLFTPGIASYQSMLCAVTFDSSAGSGLSVSGGGVWAVVSAYTAVKLYYSGTTITSGTARMYGIAKS